MSERPAGSRGFSLLELLVVIGIIALLTGMVLTVILMVKDKPRIAEAKLVIGNLDTGMASLKISCNIDPSTPIGVFGGGQTSAGTTDFSDSRRDFGTEGIAAGDQLFILDGAASGKRAVNGVAGDTLGLAGVAFATSERGLTYFIIKASGGAHPRIYPVRELDPNNSTWKTTFKPHLNQRKMRLFDVRANRVRDGWFRDPWGTPYKYELIPEARFINERLSSAGPDKKFGTDDDLKRSVAEIPFRP